MIEIIIACGAALIAIIAVIIAARRSGALEGKLERTSGAIKQLTESIGGENERLRSALNENMAQMRETVTDKLDTRLTNTFTNMNEQLSRVQRGIGEMRGIVADVSDLRKLMSNVKSRGVWGEVQLRAIFEEVLSPGQYRENIAVEPGAAERVEFAIILPDNKGDSALLSVDSKFPMEDYMRLVAAADDGSAEDYARCAKALERRLTDEAKRISTKYIKPPHTVDFAVMFLPVESLYAEAARMPGLCERLQAQYRVLIAGPGTFAALITSLRVGFRSAAIEKRGAEVIRILDGVRDDMLKMSEITEQMKKHYASLANDISALETRQRAINRRIREISE